MVTFIGTGLLKMPILICMSSQYFFLGTNHGYSYLSVSFELCDCGRNSKAQLRGSNLSGFLTRSWLILEARETYYEVTVYFYSNFTSSSLQGILCSWWFILIGEGNFLRTSKLKMAVFLFWWRHFISAPCFKLIQFPLTLPLIHFRNYILSLTS